MCCDLCTTKLHSLCDRAVLLVVNSSRHWLCAAWIEWYEAVHPDVPHRMLEPTEPLQRFVMRADGRAHDVVRIPPPPPPVWGGVGWYVCMQVLHCLDVSRSRECHGCDHGYVQASGVLQGVASNKQPPVLSPVERNCYRFWYNAVINTQQNHPVYLIERFVCERLAPWLMMNVASILPVSFDTAIPKQRQHIGCLFFAPFVCRTI